MTQDRSNADSSLKEQDPPLSPDGLLTPAQKDSYRSWRAPSSLQAETLSRFESTRGGVTRQVGWGAAVAAGLVLAVALLFPGPRLEEAAPATAGSGLTTLALHAVRMPPKPDFPSTASISVPARTLTIPRLNQISISVVTEKETL